MNAYYTNTNSQRRYTERNSDSIRKAFIANTRKRELASLLTSLLSIDSQTAMKLILALKIVGGIVCAVSFLTVLALIEAESISFTFGIVCTFLIAVLECLCFIPFQKSSR